MRRSFLSTGIFRTKTYNNIKIKGGKMASLIMHLCMTQYLQKKYNLKNEILLGAILPDIIKISKLKTKKESHYIEENENLPNINRYINVNMKNGYNQIQLGYLFHLLQDKIWYQYLNEFKNRYNGEYDGFIYKIYSDMNICDKYILNKSNIDEEKFIDIKLKLEKMSNNSEIQSCINESLKIRKIENNQIHFITENTLNEYIEKAINECELILKELEYR